MSTSATSAGPAATQKLQLDLKEAASDLACLSGAFGQLAALFSVIPTAGPQAPHLVELGQFVAEHFAGLAESMERNATNTAGVTP